VSLREAASCRGNPAEAGRCLTKGVQLVGEFVPEQVKRVRNNEW